MIRLSLSLSKGAHSNKIGKSQMKMTSLKSCGYLISIERPFPALENHRLSTTMRHRFGVIAQLILHLEASHRYEYAFRTRRQGERQGREKRIRSVIAFRSERFFVIEWPFKPGRAGVSIRRRLKHRRRTTFENRETDSQSIRNAVAIRCQSRGRA